MTPEPALWNWRSRGFASGGTSKKRRKNGSSSRGLRWLGSSFIVPRVAMLTTAGETRLTIGASEGIGAASATGAGTGAYAAPATMAAGPAMAAAASIAAANLKRRFMPILPFARSLPAHRGRANQPGPDAANRVPDITRKIAFGGPS